MARFKAERLARLSLIAFSAALALFAAWPWLPGVRRDNPHTIIVYGFSALGEVLTEGIFPAFKDHWRIKTGHEVEFASSFAGSGTVVNQIKMGVPVQVAILSHELDAEKLQIAGIVPRTAWTSLPQAGVVIESPFIIVVRAGNPLGIRSLLDLAKPHVRLVQADPMISGGALWSVLAQYAAAKAETGTREEIINILSATDKNISTQAASARAARTQFDQGFGDALITYEQEALRDQQKGSFRGVIVYPPITIISEQIALRIDKNIAPDDREVVNAFLSYLWSPEGTEIFRSFGFRVKGAALDPGIFPPLPGAVTVADLGGWNQAHAEIIEGIWKKEVRSGTKG